MKKTLTHLILFLGIATYAQEKTTTNYEYDNLNRLIKVVLNGDTETNYVYDDLGNRIGLNIKTLSIDKETLQNAITVYPNPTSNLLHIKLPEIINGNNIIIKLYDVNGKTLKNHKTSIKEATATIDVEQLPQGVYLLHLTGDNKTFSQIFIKK